jgi:1-acyl-sn-glycerol-3-phosphate acyltransferase
VQRLLLALARRAVRLYYRVERLGEAVPARGPVLLVGNHPNGLVDPVLLAGTTDRTVRFLGKAPLFEMPLLGSVMRGLEVLPVYRAQDGADTKDNARTFEAVYTALAAGEIVCLFPEGKSHDEPALAALKTGAARMALGAEQRSGFALGVQIVPVGLVYRAKPAFRSRVAVWTGAPLTALGLQKLYAEDERATVLSLTERIAQALRTVTLELERWEDLPLFELAERILFTQSEGRLARLQVFSRATRELRRREPARVAALEQRIATFAERLARLGLAAHDVPRKLEEPYRPAAVARYVARSLFVLATLLPLALLGTLLWVVPHRMAGSIPKRFSTPDTLATARIFAGALLFPTWLALVAGLAFWRLGPIAGVALLVLAPLLGLAALAYRDWRLALHAEVRTFLRLAGRAHLRELLLAERDELARELEAVRANL